MVCKRAVPPNALTASYLFKSWEISLCYTVYSLVSITRFQFVKIHKLTEGSILRSRAAYFEVGLIGRTVGRPAKHL